jgi:hypothetical protein
MKIIPLLVISLFLITECVSDNQSKLGKLVIKSSEVETALNKVLTEELKYLDPESFIILFRADKLENELEIKIAVIDKRELRIDPQNKPYGFFEYADKTGFAFGDRVDDFFKDIKDQKKSFDYLIELKSLNTKNKVPPPPPNIVEPEVWIYQFKDNKMNFVKVSRIAIL